jgi:predicted SAM-dependent methyltransferase
MNKNHHKKIKSIEIGTSYGVLANHPLLNSCGMNLKLPVSEEDGKIPTLNKNGYMIIDNDDVLQSFIEYAAHCKKPVLEIGAAYGNACIKALAKGASVIANDIDERHLLLLREMTPKDQWHQLYLNNNHFPSEIDFTDNSLDAILIRHVMHFLKPDEIELGFNKINKWLCINGHVFIVIMSPHHHYFNNFAEMYEKCWQEGNRWPGIIPNLKYYIPDQADKVPNFLHVMDHRPLQLVLEKKGFVIEKIILFDYQKHPKPKPIGLPGFCGIIAKKI